MKNINTQYKNKDENTSFSKQNQKKSKDNDSYHNLYETTINCVFLPLVHNLSVGLHTTQRTAAPSLSNWSCCNFFNCPNLFTLKRYTHSFCNTFLHVACVIVTLICTNRFRVFKRNVFDCLNSFLSLTLSSRTSLFRKRLIFFFVVGLPQTICVFVCEGAI